MCKECGCGAGNERAYFGKSGEHSHNHPHDHDHEGTSRTIALEQRVLERNDQLAEKNRQWLAERQVMALNLISSPGSGKTTLLEKTLEALRDKLPCAVIAGDQQTDNDARRLSGKGAPVCQIETKSACHLDAGRVGSILPDAVPAGIRLLFIENVGNLVCPAAFDLGEHFKIALLSVTEGEDKPEKYPALFSMSPVVLITKTDLIPHLDWDRDACLDTIRRIRPDAKIIEVSAKTGEGMDEWIGYLGQFASEPA
jgi:hydrogenase nickel incorporation protein HypB